MDQTTAKTKKSSNDLIILSYIKEVLARLGAFHVPAEAIIMQSGQVHVQEEKGGLNRK